MSKGFKDYDKKISCVKEKYPGERRAFLQPKHIKEILKLGVDVLIERDLGLDMGISNEEYKKAGATIVSQEEAWNESDMLLKYKIPIPDEYNFFRDGLIITGALHAEGKPQLVSALCDSKTTAYSYEYFNSSIVNIGTGCELKQRQTAHTVSQNVTFIAPVILEILFVMLI